MKRLVVLLVAGSVMPAPADTYWPGERSWEAVAPRDANLDASVLAAAIAYAGANRTKGLVVVRKGRIVAERYWRGFGPSSRAILYSATKSVVSILVGMAIDDGNIKGLDQPSSDFLPEWKGTAREAIRIRHHLAMSTGLHHSMLSFLASLRAPDERRFALRLALDHAPGTVWAYSNSTYRLLFSILVKATGKELDAYARERLFAPLGMRDSGWLHRRTLQATNYTFVSCSTRDLARFGLMVLRGGVWRGRRIVSRRYLRAATSPSQPMNRAYGFLWWVNAGRSHRIPFQDRVRNQRLFPGCPPDAIASLGYKDQKLYVVPSLDLVVVRLGDSVSLGRRLAFAKDPFRFDDRLLSTICRAVRKPAPVRPSADPMRRPFSR